jgi:hypothetical protein
MPCRRAIDWEASHTDKCWKYKADRCFLPQQLRYGHRHALVLVMSGPTRKTLSALASFYLKIPWWMLMIGWIMFLAGCIALSGLVTTPENWIGGTAIILLGAIVFVVAVLVRVNLESNDLKHVIMRDPEINFVWSQDIIADSVVWRHKVMAQKPASKWVGGIRVTVILYAAMTCLAAGGIGLVFVPPLLESGAGDGWLSYVIAGSLALLLLMAIVGFAWGAIHNIVPFEVTMNLKEHSFTLTGVRPLKGVVTETIDFREIAEIAVRGTTYKSIGTYRLYLALKSGKRVVLFGLLGANDYARIRSGLARAGF